MALERKGSPIVVPAIRVADLPALPADISDSAGMGKWWNDFRQVLARLIQSRSDTTQAQPPQSPAPVVEQPAAQEPKPVDWDSIINKPEKFPPIEHTHTTPWLQVEEPLSLSEIDPATNLATLGFHEQKAGHFLAGPLSGPVAKPVFRPLHSGDDGNLDDSGIDDLPGGDFSDIQDTLFDTHPTFSLEWSHRAATATHCGFAPLNGVETTPPTRWRTETFGGTMVVHHAGSYDSCELPRLYTRTAQYAGTNTFDGCTPVAGATVTNSRCGTTSTTPVSALAGDWGEATESTAAYTQTRSQTVHTVTGTGACYQGDVCSYLGNGPCDGAGTVSRTLGNPDDDDAAWQRAIAGVSWSEWGAAVAAAYEERTSLSFYRCELKGRGAGSNAVAGWTYTIEIPTEQRPYGSGADWTDGGTITLSITADGSGNLTLPEFDVPCPNGYERIPTGDFILSVGL